MKSRRKFENEQAGYCGWMAISAPAWTSF